MLYASDIYAQPSDWKLLYFSILIKRGNYASFYFIQFFSKTVECMNGCSIITCHKRSPFPQALLVSYQNLLLLKAMCILMTPIRADWTHSHTRPPCDSWKQIRLQTRPFSEALNFFSFFFTVLLFLVSRAIMVACLQTWPEHLEFET